MSVNIAIKGKIFKVSKEIAKRNKIIENLLTDCNISEEDSFELPIHFEDLTPEILQAIIDFEEKFPPKEGEFEEIKAIENTEVVVRVKRYTDEELKTFFEKYEQGDIMKFLVSVDYLSNARMLHYITEYIAEYCKANFTIEQMRELFDIVKENPMEIEAQ